MRRPLALALLAGLLALLPTLGACQREAEAPPAPFAMTEEAMGRYCGMNVLEHAGPKGQIILAKYDEPIWFSSARDAVAFTMLFFTLHILAIRNEILRRRIAVLRRHAARAAGRAGGAA